MARIHVMLCLDARADVGRVTRMWFELAWSRLAAGLHDGLDAGPRAGEDVTSTLMAGRIWETYPPVGMPWCELVRFDGEFDDEVATALLMHPHSLSVFLDGLDQHPGATAYLQAGVVERAERMPGGRGPGFPDLHVRTWIDGGVWLGLSASAEFLVGTVDAERALCGFLREVAAASDPAFGGVSLQVGEQQTDESLLERSLVGLDSATRDTIRRTSPRERLKGYSWITVIPGEVAARLGGAAGLRASGAFHEVVALPAGGIWAQATARLADYDHAAARRAFDVLRSVLPPGWPMPAAGVGPVVDEAP
ncbi:hypothetical protein ACFO1B_51030 [Dactylosporangium siamense]|uniref:DUF3396 domain-containing protein n=1 Tax=Dactylosporangium siamense TaxID=685454 RepID=A0A919UHH5_9ACTN|nr:hypothetical protein [Dactylosporangium siamense]GIG52406.1 hypothetical protein Dsi01nite_104470 [Dactylosporangium siamense]